MGQTIFKRTWAMTFWVGLACLIACQATTVAPGVEQTGKETRTTIAATPKEVAEAAAVVLQELELSDVRGMATRLDGRVTAMTSLGEVVEVVVLTAGTRTSQLTVSNNAGKGLAFEILQEIEARVYGQSSPDAASERGVTMINPSATAVEPAAAEQAIEEPAPATNGGIVPLDQLPPPRVEQKPQAEFESTMESTQGGVKKR